MATQFTHIDTTSPNVRQHWRAFLDRIATRLGQTEFAIADARRHERPWLTWMAHAIGTNGGGSGDALLIADGSFLLIADGSKLLIA